MWMLLKHLTLLNWTGWTGLDGTGCSAGPLACEGLAGQWPAALAYCAVGLVVPGRQAPRALHFMLRLGAHLGHYFHFMNILVWRRRCRNPTRNMNGRCPMPRPVHCFLGNATPPERAPHVLPVSVTAAGAPWLWGCIRLHARGNVGPLPSLPPQPFADPHMGSPPHNNRRNGAPCVCHAPRSTHCCYGRCLYRPEAAPLSLLWRHHFGALGRGISGLDTHAVT